MVTLPDIASLGPRPVARPVRGVAGINTDAIAAPARALGQTGQVLDAFGAAIFDRETTAQATDRDNAVSAQIRDLLYNPENGFTTMQGQNAVNAQASIMARLDELQQSSMEGLNGTAQRKLQDSVFRRLEGARQAIQTHTLGQRDAWLAGSSAARIENARQDGLANLGDTDRSLEIIMNETRARGVREGWSSEQLNVELRAAGSGLITDQANRIAITDPVAALEYVRANSGRMAPSDVAAMEAQLAPAISERIGREVGASVYDRANVTDPAQAALANLEAIAGRSFNINSAFRDPEHNAAVGGANNSQHTHGNAFDIDVSGMPEAEKIALIEQARAAGFGGVGVYNNALHFDVGPTRFWGPDYSAGSLPGWAADAVQAPRGEIPTMGLPDLLEIENPIERAAAVQEFELRGAVAAGEQKAALAAAQDSVFQHIEAGGRISDLPVSTTQALGQDAMTSLRSYERSIASGVTVATDPAAYYELRQMQANDPAAFQSVNMLEYIDKLDETDLQSMMNAQTTPASDATLVAASTLMTTADRQLEAAGYDTSPDAGSDDAKLLATVQTRLLRWQEGFAVENRRAPTQTEIDAKIGQELVQVTINPPGMSNESTSPVMALGDLNIAPDALANSDVTIGQTAVPANVISEAIATLEGNGLTVSAENLVGILNVMMANQ